MRDSLRIRQDAVSLWDDDDGQAAAIASLLLAAIVVVMLVGVGFLVYEQFVPGAAPPAASFDYEYDAENGALRVVHQSGDPVEGTVKVVVVGEDGTRKGSATVLGEGGVRSRLTAGEAITVDDAGGYAVGDVTIDASFAAGDEVRLVFEEGRTSAIVGAYTIDADAPDVLSWDAPTAGLSTYYPLDESPTDVVEDKAAGGGDADGVLRGATTGVSGKRGTAYEFDASNGEYVALRESFDSSGRFPAVTACAWFRTSVNGQGEFDNWALLDFDRSEYFNLYVVGNGSVGFSTASSSGTIHDQSTGNTYADGSWHHACGVFDGTTKRIYVDGTLVDTRTPGYGSIGTGTTRYGFVGDGSEAGSFDGSRNNEYYDGRVDEVRLYDRALSGSEVGSLYDADRGAGGSAPTGDLLLYYPLDEDYSGGGSNTVADAAPQGSANPGERFGPTPGVAGQQGTAYAFADGGRVALDQRFDAAATIDAMTACAWFRTSASGGDFDNWALLDFDRSEYFNLYVEGDGQVGFSSSSPSANARDLSTPGSSYNDGTWHHACAVYTGSEKRIYVDGSRAVTATQHGGESLGTGTTRYGFLGDGSEAGSYDGSRNGLFYDGRLDEVRYYERALSDREIAALHVFTGGSPSSYTTEAKRHPSALSAGSLTLQDVRASGLGSGSVTITVESDPNGDGSYVASDPISLDGSGGPYSVTGLSKDSDRFRLVVQTSGGASVSHVELGE